MPAPRIAFATALASTALLAGNVVSAASVTEASDPGTATVDRVIGDGRINESSGLVASRRHAGVLYTHNDSGDRPRIFATARTGSTRAVLKLPHAQARDWEDISAGPNQTLWIGDIGDNRRRRDRIQVYRISEPATLTSKRVKSTRYELAYRDGAHDAEALLVRPNSGRLYVVSKQASGAAIYAAPRTLKAHRVNRLTKVRSAPPTVTAGDLAPGGEMVLRNYSRMYVYPSMRGQSQTIDLPEQPQGESAAFAAGGETVLVGSERLNSTVWRVTLP